MSDYEWTEYASNPDDGNTIIRLIKENESLEQEVARLKEENLKLKRCENCYHFDIIDECRLNAVSCIRYDKWEIEK